MQRKCWQKDQEEFSRLIITWKIQRILHKTVLKRSPVSLRSTIIEGNFESEKCFDLVLVPEFDDDPMTENTHLNQTGKCELILIHSYVSFMSRFIYVFRYYWLGWRRIESSRFGGHIWDE